METTCTFASMLGGNFITVPSYQCAFSWDTNEKGRQVNTFYESLCAYRDTSVKYNLGHFLFQKKDDLQYEVIDGQQRLTTGVLFLSTAYHCLETIRPLTEFENFAQKMIYYAPKPTYAPLFPFFNRFRQLLLYFSRKISTFAHLFPILYMPKRTTHTAHTATPRPEVSSIQVEKASFGTRFRAFFTDKRTHYICSIILFAMAIFIAVAYISYYFTGTADQSLLAMSRAERHEHRLEAQNPLGIMGAAIANFLIDGSFGCIAILWSVLLICYAIALWPSDKRIVSPIRVSFYALFWLLWTPLLLGFTQMLCEAGTFRWGGMYGEWIAALLNSYIHPIGVILLLAVVLIIYLVITVHDFIPRVQNSYDKLVVLSQRISKSDSHADEIVPDTPPTIDGDGTSEGDTVQIVPNEIIPDDTEEEEHSDNTIDLTNTSDSPASTDGFDVPDAPASSEDFFKIENPANDTSDTPQDSEPADTQIPEPLPKVDSTDTGDTINLHIEQTKAVDLAPDDPERILQELGPYDPRKDLEYYKFPSLDLLKVYDNETTPIINHEEQQANALRIKTTLSTYGIEIESIKATVGPTVTLYEIVPKAGIRIAKIQNLENDIMMSLAAKGIRIIAPMPGKGTIGIEVPNENAQIVSMHSVIASKRFQEEQKMHLPIAIGRTITNEVFMFDLAKTPHLLVAGATGQGKSVAINAIITSLLYKKHPAELKFVMVDPKMVEFAPYKPLLRHYLAAMPDVDENDIVITDCDKVVNTLNSLVIEMENRYKLLMDAGVRNLEDYNDKFVRRRLNPNKLVADSLHHRYLPYIVIIIDEYGDFIMQAGKQVETPIARITQKARAVGMHMILATQRPSVNIVTGVIKANIPTSIALRTKSVIDSRTILDTKGADQLIGRGDMLYSGNGNITRIQCAFVDTPEVDKIVEHISHQQRYTEPYQLPEYIPEGQEGEALAPGSVDMKRLDPMFADVARYVVTKQEGSTSRLQRAFEIGYNRAGKLSDQLEAAGIVGPNKGPKGRDVLITDLEALEQLLHELGQA